jgi:uncharacterized membrane protein YqiK
VTESQLLVVVVGLVALVLFGTLLVVVKRSWHSVPQGQALIVNRMQGEPRVTFSGAIVMPLFHRAERMDLSVRRIEIERRGKDGVICRDGIRADLKVTFHVRVNRVVEDILKVAQSIGCARAADPATLHDLFTAKFSEAIKTVIARRDFEELIARRDELKDEIISVIGRDLNGFVLDDAAIDYLEQTPLEILDPNNVHDARGIKKILASSEDIDELRRRHRQRELSSAREQRPPEVTKPALQAELEQLGLLDLRVTTEVSCDVAPGRAALTVVLDGDVAAAAARLPSSVARAVIAAAGRGELTCADGRATFRWTQTAVTSTELIAGARLVHALREDDHAYR